MGQAPARIKSLLLKSAPDSNPYTASSFPTLFKYNTSTGKAATTMLHPGAAFPAEIIHLIIDLIAESEPTKRGELLRTCAMVSRTFHVHTRKHIFSHLRFQFSDNISNRDRWLFRLLTNPHNQDLHSYIRSVTVVLGPVTPSFQNGLQSTSTPDVLRVFKASLRSVSRKLRLGSSETSNDFISSVIDFLLGLQSLKSLALTSHSPNFVSWTHVLQEIPLIDRLLLVASKPTIRQLHFKLIRMLPKAFLLGGSDSPGITHFSFCGSNFNRYKPAPPFVILDLLTDKEAQTIRNRVQSLEYLQWDCVWTGLTDFLWPNPSQSNSIPPFSPTLCAQFHLIAVVIRIPGLESGINYTLQFLLSVSGTLQSLELSMLDLDLSYRQIFADIDATYLANFTALRHLGYKTRWNDINSAHALESINLFSRLLFTAHGAHPLAISTITIVIQDMSDDLFTLLHTGLISDHPYRYFNRRSWSELDYALSNPIFVDLNTIKITIKSYMAKKPQGFLTEIPNAQSHMRHIIPSVYHLPSATVKVSLETIVGKNAYKRWAYQDEFDERFPHE